MNFQEFDTIKEIVLKKLKDLSPELTYHNLSHMLDVLQQSERIAKSEGISEQEIYLLKVAALYHDVGFLRVYHNHEEAGCQIFLEDAIHFDFTEEEKLRIQKLILATKVPQQPGNHLEQIICDADLDYLGRDDFFAGGHKLYKEFIQYGIVRNQEEWETLQIRFLQNHHYHTKTSIQNREPVKQQHLIQLL